MTISSVSGFSSHVQPVAQQMPYRQFAQDFLLQDTSTEQRHEITRNLSQVTSENVRAGLELLVLADEKVVEGYWSFLPHIDSVSIVIAQKMKLGGRLFIVGSGSSGRVGVDLGAKCRKAFGSLGEQVYGLVAGGDSAMIRPKEGFEDSKPSGKKLLEGHGITENDVVILVSASGSATFNEGCGEYAADLGAKVYYFYNSNTIPDRTRALLERKTNPVTGLCVDIGPQAISGSTRLQAATLAECCLGALLATSFYRLQDNLQEVEVYKNRLLEQMKVGIALLRDAIPGLENFVRAEYAVFSDPRASFRSIQDRGEFGYVTFLALEDSMREVLIDSTESSPTFSTNPMRRESEAHKKRPEFSAYLAGYTDNLKAWSALLGRDVSPSDIEDADSFILAAEASGLNSYARRPTGAGNFVIAVAKGDKLPELLDRDEVGGVILLSNTQASVEPKSGYKATVVFENVPHDVMGISETILLKQALNLISNGSMVLMNKVYGNLMIDVRASNNKLVGRVLRLIQEIWSEAHPDTPLQDEVVYQYIVQVKEKMKEAESRGIYVPSIVKIVLHLFAHGLTVDDFEKAVEALRQNGESIQLQ